jgi:hypothetical protein
MAGPAVPFRAVLTKLWNGFWLPTEWNPAREIADDIARVYVMPQTACQVVWPGCEGTAHRCVRRKGHDGFHRCDCGTPYGNGNGNGHRSHVQRRWRAD